MPGEGDRAQLLAAVRAVLERQSGSGPLLVAFQDLHWADASTREVLAFLASQPPRGPVMFVATYRDDDRAAGALRRADRVSWTPGRAEALPLADDSITIVWSLSSAHHWGDLTAALGEIRRVLVPGGEMLLAERLTRPGARGLAAHGFTRSRAEALAEQMTATGFADARIETLQAGRRNLVIISGAS